MLLQQTKKKGLIDSKIGSTVLLPWIPLKWKSESQEKTGLSSPFLDLNDPGSRYI